MPLLEPLPLLLNNPWESIPIYTLYRLCTALPSRIQSLYIEGLNGIPRGAQQSLRNYMELYLTPAVLAKDVAMGNELLEEYDVGDARVSSDAHCVRMVDGNEDEYYLRLMSGVTEIKVIFEMAELYPLNITIVGVVAWFSCRWCVTI